MGSRGTMYIVIIVHSNRHHLHATTANVPGCAFTFREIPERSEAIVQAIQTAGFGTFIEPKSVKQGPLLAVHSADYLDYLQNAYSMRQAFMGDDHPIVAEAFAVRTARRKPTTYPGINGWYAYDNAAPILSGTWEAACVSAECALTASYCVYGGERAAYALCRPPGHHAASNLAGGYCYLNNAAIATRLLQRQHPARVAIIDIDFHHGNGTQEIFYNDPSVLYVSLHADTTQEYPFFWGDALEVGEGEGHGFNYNYPLADDTTDAAYLTVLDKALEVVRQFNPTYLVVSAGFDLMQGDPEVLGLGFAITIDGLKEISKRIAALQVPAVIVQEGGYNIERLGEYAVTFLREFT